MPCPVVLALIDYWAQCPPTHLLLARIAHWMGIKTAAAAVSTAAAASTFRTQPYAELSDAEKWVDAGYLPGQGKIKTLEHSELPITVREMIVKLQQQQKDVPHA